MNYPRRKDPAGVKVKQAQLAAENQKLNNILGKDLVNRLFKEGFIGVGDTYITEGRLQIALGQDKEGKWQGTSLHNAPGATIMNDDSLKDKEMFAPTEEIENPENANEKALRINSGDAFQKLRNSFAEDMWLVFGAQAFANTRIEIGTTGTSFSALNGHTPLMLGLKPSIVSTSKVEGLGGSKNENSSLLVYMPLLTLNKGEFNEMYPFALPVYGHIKSAEQYNAAEKNKELEADKAKIEDNIANILYEQDNSNWFSKQKKWYWDKEYQGTAKLLAETRGDLSEDYAKVKGADEIMKFEINILRLSSGGKKTICKI